MPEEKPSKLLGIAPFFFVTDIHRSVAFYRDVLGFHISKLWGEPPCFAMPIRDRLVIMLCQADDPKKIQPNGNDGEAWDAYIWVTDADALFAEFTSKNVTVHYPPVDRNYYGNREFAIKDPDGFVIAFAHDIAAKAKSAP